MSTNSLNFFAQCELYFLPIFILVILFFTIKGQKMFSLEQKLFYFMVVAIFTIICSDFITFLLNQAKNPKFIMLNLILCAIYYILNPLACFLWAVYVDYIINRSTLRLRKFFIYLSVPLVINALLSIISIFNGASFYVDNTGVYHRGNLFFLMAVICFIYLMYPTFYVFLNKKRIEKEYYNTSLLFPLLPIIGAVIQIHFYGVVIIWQATTVSLLLVYVQILNISHSTDYLTGLFNRKQLDYYLNDKLKSFKRRSDLAGIMIDVDNFKKINDVYGHQLGDKVLKIIATTLKFSVDKGTFIARYGGDEFVILLENVSKSQLEDTIHKIEANVEKINSNKTFEENISLSMGYDIYHFDRNFSSDMFLDHIDGLMYEQKSKKKR